MRHRSSLNLERLNLAAAFAALSLIAPLSFTGCGSQSVTSVSPPASPPGPAAGAGGQPLGPFTGTDVAGHLYVANSGSNSLLRFDTDSFSSGNLTPAGVIGGPTTRLNGPHGITIDPETGRLYVANSNGASILIFDNVSELSGNVAPDRILAGAATELARPTDVQYDLLHDDLYVADPNLNAILVFDHACTANGNVAPARVIQGTNTGLSGVQGLYDDPGANRLYAANFLGQSVELFDNASSLNGNVKPAAVVQGASAGAAGPVSLQQARYGSIAIANGGNASVALVPSGAFSLLRSGPLHVVSGGNSGINGIGQIFYLPPTDSLYVACSGSNAVLVFSSVSDINGNVAPARTIQGATTQLSGPLGVAYEITGAR